MLAIPHAPLDSSSACMTSPSFSNDSKPDFDSDDGWDSDSDDGWGTDGDMDALESSMFGTSQQIESAPKLQTVQERPNWNMSEREKLPVELGLENFVMDESGYNLYRCEPAKKMNPTLCGLSQFSEYESVHISIRLLNAEKSVVIRTPDLKRKCLNAHRLDQGVLVNAKKEHSVRFKKKCQDKSGNDTAFELGKGFMSHTLGATPQFIFVAIPYCGGYVPEKAVRSPPFRIFSKRQERFLEPKKKRRRKNVEIQKLDTDIQNAKATFHMMEQELRHAEFINGAMGAFFNQLRSHVANIEDDTTRIALEFALRCEQENETASM